MKNFPQPLLAIFKNPFNVAPHKQPVHQRAAARSVAHVVPAERAAIKLFERMGVMPERVRAAHLHVHEEMRRLPGGDFRPPTDRNSMDTNPVVNQRASFDRDWFRSEHFKVEPRRSDSFQILHVAEELENFRARPRQPEFGLQREFFHARLKLRLDATRPQRAPAAQGFKQHKSSGRRQHQAKPD